MNGTQRRAGDDPPGAKSNDHDDQAAGDQQIAQRIPRLVVISQRARQLDDAHQAILNHDRLAVNQQPPIVGGSRFRPRLVALRCGPSCGAQGEIECPEVGRSIEDTPVGRADLNKSLRRSEMPAIAVRAFEAKGPGIGYILGGFDQTLLESVQ
jgi:hypothetical protein